MPSHIEETNQALEKHLEETKTRDAIVATLCGVVFGVAVYVLLGTGGATSSGGISPTLTTREGWPVLGAGGLVGAAVVARALYTHLRQRRRRRFWGL